MPALSGQGVLLQDLLRADHDWRIQVELGIAGGQTHLFGAEDLADAKIRRPGAGGGGEMFALPRPSKQLDGHQRLGCCGGNFQEDVVAGVVREDGLLLHGERGDLALSMVAQEDLQALLGPQCVALFPGKQREEGGFAGERNGNAAFEDARRRE